MIQSSNAAEINLLVTRILDICFKIHSQYGPGMLESFYESVLSYELTRHGIQHECQVPIRVHHNGHPVGIGYRIDILVEDTIILELKAVETLAPVHHRQTLTYPKIAGKPLALLINFGAHHLKDGIFRKANGL